MRRKFTIGTQTKDGTIYLPPGGGIVTSGHSFEAVGKANALLNLVHPAEQWVREHADWIVSQVERATGVRVGELRLRFDTSATLTVHKATLVELETKAVLLGVPPPPGAWPAVCTMKRAPEA